MTHFEFFSITFSEKLPYFSNKINQLKLSILRGYINIQYIKNNHTYFRKWYQILTNIDYWQGHERSLCMVTCGLLTNHRHGNHILMYSTNVYIHVHGTDGFTWPPNHGTIRVKCLAQGRGTSIRNLAYFDSHMCLSKYATLPITLTADARSLQNLSPWNSKSVWIMPTVLTCAVITLCEH